MGSFRPPRRRVLVIDDEEDVLQFVSIVLEDAGYAVECVASGAAALATLADHRPDLIVLDLMTPGMDGWQVLRSVRGHDLSLPIVILSAFVRPEVAVREGAAATVPKPFDPADLVRACRKAVTHASH